jgi:hypothetical protein
VHGQKRRDAARGGTVGLQALEFVDRLVEAPLYGGLVTRELREGVLLVGVSDKGPAKAPLFSTENNTLLFIYCRFYGQNPAKPSDSGNDPVCQEYL